MSSSSAPILRMSSCIRSGVIGGLDCPSTVWTDNRYRAMGSSLVGAGISPLALSTNGEGGNRQLSAKAAGSAFRPHPLRVRAAPLVVLFRWPPAHDDGLEWQQDGR